MARTLSRINLGNGSELLIREALQMDIPDLISMSQTTDRFRMSEFTDAIDAEELEFWVADSRTIVIVAVVDNKVVGYAYGFCISQKWFAFDAIAVKPGHRGMGIGSKMYETLRGECKLRGFDLIQGLVKDDEQNRLGYWQQHGFEVGQRCIWVEDWLDT